MNFIKRYLAWRKERTYQLRRKRLELLLARYGLTMEDWIKADPLHRMRFMRNVCIDGEN